MKVTVDGLIHEIDIEAKMASCQQITQDLRALATGVLEHDMTTDNIANVVIGLEDLYSVKFKMLLNDYNLLIKSIEQNKS